MDEKKKKTIYCYDPALFFPIFLKFCNLNPEWELEHLIIGNRVYFLKLVSEKKIVWLKNINRLITSDIHEFIVNEKYTYKYIPYWKEKKIIKLIEPNEKINLFLNKIFQTNEKVESFFKHDDEDFIVNEEEILKILKNNLIYLNECLNILNKNFSWINSFWYNKISSASISTEYFIKNKNPYKLKLLNSIEIDRNIRPSFFGGRCEVWGNPYFEKEKIFRFDFPNQYGNIFKQKFPIGNLEESYEFDLMKPGFSYIKGFSSKGIPVLPSRSNYGALDNEEQLIFSHGEIEGLYWNEEIQEFLKKGNCVEKFEKAYYFNKNKEVYLFKDFSENLIELRNIGNSKLWKSLIVSLYGRLAMKPIESKIILVKEKNYEKNLNYEILKENWIEDWFLMEIKCDVKETNSLVQYASIITSRARLQLLKIMEEVEKTGGRILYIDTDEIFAAYPFNYTLNQDHFHYIKWELNSKKNQIKDAVFAGPRCYSLKFYDDSWETKIAGVKRNFIEFNKFKKDFYSSWIVYSHLRQDLWFLNKLKEISEKEINLNNYKKRKFSIDKKNTDSLWRINKEFRSDIKL